MNPSRLHRNNRLKLNNMLCFLTALTLIQNKAFGEDLRSSPVSIKIKLSKNSFTIDEPLTAKATIRNDSPQTLSTMLQITIYRNNIFHYRIETTIPDLFPGTNTFSLQDIGLSLVNYGTDPSGPWSLVIAQKDLEDQIFDKTDFTITND